MASASARAAPAAASARIDGTSVAARSASDAAWRAGPQQRQCERALTTAKTACRVAFLLLLLHLQLLPMQFPVVGQLLKLLVLQFLRLGKRCQLLVVLAQPNTPMTTTVLAEYYSTPAYSVKATYSRGADSNGVDSLLR